jgi:RNA polymerase sigma-70 factor (ECF subfamily)
MGETLNWQPDFEQLVGEHQSMVFSLAWRMTGDRGLAEEIAQDVLLELDRHLPHLGSANHARYWLRQVALHRSTDALRRRRTKAASLGTDVWDELEEQHGVVEIDRESPLGLRLEQLLAALPAAQRAAIVLRYQEGMTPDEISVMVRAPIATVKSNLQRGLKQLRDRAEETLKEFVRGS